MANLLRDTETTTDNSAYFARSQAATSDTPPVRNHGNSSPVWCRRLRNLVVISRNRNLDVAFTLFEGLKVV